MQEVTLAKLSTPIIARVVSCTPGRIRLRVPYPNRQSGNIKRITEILEVQPEISQVRNNIANGSIVINYNHDLVNLAQIAATIRNSGIVFSERKQGKSTAAEQITETVFGLNQQVKRATSDAIDLRFLLPLGFSALALRQLLAKGLQFESIPWYVLAWYAFDSFIKLHYTTEEQP
ncbi:MAG: hypothetical protein JOZ78_26685 [Chroococcidiopsidaceae cyanobacterium CP_BM_ER_R8_30]|nr:hypothetical protein [Chroococcidiopsidaceae cyanobacterium CP_BM_ER_R8_30]